ncbi:MAG TPA: hypothetical protein VFZ16_02100, partial [Hyphomicrobiaceae bacterium]|nr:hypothetical protein [Hyphomicrobiaceae bacterium]
VASGDLCPVALASEACEAVAGDAANAVLAYNIKRVIAILGVPTLIEAIRAFLSLLAALVRLTGASSARRTAICAK